MFKALRSWINEDESSQAEAKAAAAAERARAEAERRLNSRLDRRYDFAGSRMTLRTRRVQWIMNLKDLSCRGACGISEIPLSIGALVFLELKKKRFHAAEVRWVRNALIGLQFIRELEPDMVEKFHASHMAKKARAESRSSRR